jgi:hypothetical protein
MTTHDFSKPRPPAASGGPPPAPGRGRPSNLVLAAGALAVVAFAVGAFVLLRGGEDGKTTEVVSPRFCQVSLQLTSALGGIGVPPVGPVPDNVGPEAVKAALDSVGGLDDLVTTAPSGVTDDARQVVGDLRAAASGDMAGARSSAFTKAEERIAAVQRPPYGCPVGSGSSGDG